MNNNKTPYDKIKCDYCNTMYTRKNRAQHRKSKFCKAYQDINTIFKKLVLKVGPDMIKTNMKDLIAHPYTDKKGKTIYLTDNQYNFYSKLNIPKK